MVAAVIRLSIGSSFPRKTLLPADPLFRRVGEAQRKEDLSCVVHRAPEVSDFTRLLRKAENNPPPRDSESAGSFRANLHVVLDSVYSISRRTANGYSARGSRNRRGYSFPSPESTAFAPIRRTVDTSALGESFLWPRQKKRSTASVSDAIFAPWRTCVPPLQSGGERATLYDGRRFLRIFSQCKSQNAPIIFSRRLFSHAASPESAPGAEKMSVLRDAPLATRVFYVLSFSMDGCTMPFYTVI